MRKLVVLLTVGIAVALTGCTKSQSENCKKLIACTEALTPGTGAAMESSYGASGACWTWALMLWATAPEAPLK